ADRPEVDDRASAVRAHCGRNRLGAEELVLEVHVEAVVPIILGDVLDGMAVVIGRVVDQHIDPTELLDRFPGCADIGQIDANESGAHAARKVVGIRAVDVEEGNLRSLLGEPLDDACPDARPTARYEHLLAAKAWVGCAPFLNFTQCLIPPRTRSSSAYRIRPP